MVYFNSQQEQCRFPFGAVVVNTEIKFQIHFDDLNNRQVYLCYQFKDAFKKFEMVTSNGAEYLCTVKMPDVPGLVWYYFEICEHGSKYFYGNNLERLGGVGHIYSYDPFPYQITVFAKEFEVPSWFRRQIMYQIFPDRFCNGNLKNEILRKDSEYKYYDNWTDEMDIGYSCNGKIRNDFYGGNIKGVLSKIEYLKQLGISVIYFNPVFEAYSNHRYDTGNFKKIDPIFGTNEEFEQMVEVLKENGISVILDGVFNHTGDDSIYFNRFGKYDSIGACQGSDSPYYEWFNFEQFPDKYDCWWGIKNVPSVNEMHPSYLDYIIRDDDAVIAKWLKAGIAGWRLDVADELPSEFLELLRDRIKKENKDAMIIGEVWEDASNKCSYGEEREYFLGKQLDSVMNYPFYDVILGFANGNVSADMLAKKMMSIIENYPKHCLYSTMNMLSTHDKPRAITVLGSNAINKFKLATVFQMTYIGVPSIYYGDEIGMEGGKDPLNRAAFKWHDIDEELLEFVKATVRIRKEKTVLAEGLFRILFAQKSIFVFLRYNDNGKNAFGEVNDEQPIIVVLNNSESEWANVEIDLDEVFEFTGKRVTEITSIFGLAFVNDINKLSVSPMGAGIFECQ